MPTPEQIDTAIRMVARDFDGMSGNCARFAAMLNKVVGGEGNYLLVESGHYEFSDHVYLDHLGMLFDSEGMKSFADVEEQWSTAADADEDDAESDYPEDEEYSLEEFHDPSPEGAEIRKTVDSANPLAACWGDEDLEDAFRAAFASLGADLGNPAADNARP